MNEPAPKFSRRAQKTIAEFRRVPTGEPNAMRKRVTKDLADLIEELRVKHRIGRAAPEDAIREAWPEIVGSANATYSHPLRIEGRKLIVQATHSVVRNELFLHRKEIASRLQKLPGCAEVKELHIRAG